MTQFAFNMKLEIPTVMLEISEWMHEHVTLSPAMVKSLNNCVLLQAFDKTDVKTLNKKTEIDSRKPVHCYPG